MASLTGNPPLLRPRPPRPPANTGKPLQATARLTATSSANSTATAAAQLPPTVSSVSLFLTNLRLLDLDLRPDWPDINPLTFTAKDAAQGQKKRIQCVEWALYQLFCLWDPDEARNKLQPFFPPLDQVQSLNLRAALLRCLEQAKKNGVLGRDVLIRKTMLDECKGERMEEVLAVFSSAVLKNLVAEQQLNHPDHPALAQTLALENRGYSGQTTDLSILALAHRASLSRHLRDKDASRAGYRDFSELMDLKERTLARRREQSRALEAQEKESGALDNIDEHVQHGVCRTVRSNWSGNERWMETLLQGDIHSRKDGLLSTPFDKVWRRVQAGRLSELEDQTDGLLQQLDRRVKTQKERLEKWRTFRAEIVGTASSQIGHEEGRTTVRQRGIDLGFGAHENLLLGRMSPRKLPRGKPGQLTAEYSDIIDSLQHELTEVSKPPAPASFQRSRPRADAAVDYLEAPAEETVSEISELEEEDHGASLNHDEPENTDNLHPVIPSNAIESNTLAATDTEEEEPEPTVVSPQEFPIPQKQHQISTEERSRMSPSPTRAVRRPTTPVTRSPVHRTPSPRKASPRKASPPVISPPWVSPPKPSASKPAEPSPEPPLSPTQALADQILASMNAATPSPVKKPRHTLSLAERTRLSMARRDSKGPSLDDDDDEPDLTLSLRSPPTVTISPVQPTQSLSIPEEPDEQGYEDLVSRTRRSMAGFEAARKKAQLERRRSQRQSSRPQPAGHRRDGSMFAAVDEEGEMGDTTLLLAEELMNNETDDYEAIFKSRPKIKTSPVGTPVKGGWDD
ncbi:HAUS augmin-like complex subunit 6 N-terminus-domain-containing protein [Coniochaeta sp. 2T2.1]|nr:HAUS augmin-like complex subunit 6 N-terminus-domain-containing protein [Coniochaeta sp. 2T2.1]